MSPRFSVLASVFALSCAAEPDLGTFVHRDGPRTPAPLEEGEEPRALLVTLDADGHAVALLDPESSEVVASRPLPEAHAWDLVASPAVGDAPSRVALQSRALEDEPAGDVSSLTVATPGQLGEPVMLGHVEGETTILASPFGVVTSEADLGERWRLIPWGGGFTKSLACGRPLSVRVVSRGPTTIRYEVLSFFPEGALSSLDVEVQDTGVTRCEPTALEGLEPASDGISLVELGLGYTRAAADVQGGTLWLGALDGEAVASWAGLEIGSSRLDSIVRFRQTDDRAVLVAVGAEPARVTLFEVQLDEAGALLVGRAEVQELAGEPPRRGRSPSRSLVVQGSWVFVATSAGVEPFEIDEAELRLLRAPVVSSARGPLASVTLP
ncbi:MAG: hypothetical protein JNL21_11560 [Myxococcales bacterium]|nr:hypothetical protein [Myxococcales bacterium]